MEHNLILCLHEHINNFNKSMTLATDLDRDRLYVTCATNNAGFLEPISYCTAITTSAVVSKKNKHKHKYKGGCKVRKDFYIDQIIRDCVYILYNEDLIVYVGQSKNIYNRLTSHIRDKEFNRVRYLHCREDRKLYWEKVLIDRYQPMYNKHKWKAETLLLRKKNTWIG